MSNIFEPVIRLEWDTAAQFIANAHNIVTITHMQPDGDAIGSMMGITLALREHGKNVIPVVDRGLPPSFAFVPQTDLIRDRVDGLEFDLIISTDSSDTERLGELGKQLLSRKGVPLIQLDHHRTNIMFGQVNLVDSRFCSAAEGVLAWLDQLSWEISPDVAQCLLTGIVTDTIGFRTANVTPQTLEKAQRLMTLGANLAQIVQMTVSRTTLAQVRLQAQVLPRLQIEDGVIWVTTTLEDFAESGVDIEEGTGFAGYLIQIDEAKISASFTEMEGGAVACSFRSILGYDVSQVAFELGGGGHVQASGCTLRNLALDEAIAKVIPLLKAEVLRGKPVYA